MNRRLVSFSLAWTVTLPVHSAEILSNPGFEELAPHGFPAAWSRYGGTVPESVTKSVEEARSGALAARMTDTGPNERDGRWSTGVCQTVAVEPGKTYVASVWAKSYARNHPSAVSLQLRFLPTNKIHMVRIRPPVGGGWRKSVTVGVAPKDATQARIYIYTEHFWTSDTVIDDASLISASKEELGARFALLSHGSMGVERARPLKRRTVIAEDGAAKATICMPEVPEYRKLGQQIQEAVRERSGAVLPVVTNGRDLLGTDGTIVAVGNMNNNFVIERLYFNKYTGANALYPGKGRYTMRTVHQPFNFGDTVNVLMVGASDFAGAERGVRALLERLPNGPAVALDEPLLVVSDQRPLSPERAQEMLRKPLSRDWFRDFWNAARAYRDSGDLAHAKNARRILLEIAKRYEDEPDHRITWPDETSSNMIGTMWDVIEEAPVFSDDDRLRCMNALLICQYSLPRHVSGWGRQTDNDTITWNHTTFPILGIYYLARYFRRWYGDLDGRLDHLLGEVHGCFRGQFKSWKPQCDADGYLTIVPRHIVDYSLAEGNYQWFESGMARKHAEYLTCLTDNRGAIPGLGDSGYGTRPGYELVGLGPALWYYKDGRYLWRLQQIFKGKWKNPYEPAPEPKVWHEMAGLTVTRLNPENYNYTKTRSYYGEPIEPPNVPYEKAFDKVTFRENLDPNGEFLLLDGYARGKHLHYDGNAIIKFYADGHDWLIDGDYLVRNTTDHTMVSIIKNGRCDQFIPVCTALDAHADLPSVAFVDTTVHNYNGADWRREILWEKGQYFLVIDECEAKEDAEFTFEAVWKALDTGNLRLIDGRVFEVTREAFGGVGNRDLSVVRKPAPGVERALKFTTSYSQLDFGLHLPKGRYVVTMVAYGLNGGADSFWLSVDGGEKTAFHIPILKFGPSSSAYTKAEPSPNVTVKSDGLHRFTVTLREAPNVMLDRLIFQTPKGETVATIEAEDAPPLPKSMHRGAPLSRFYVKCDGFALTKLVKRINNVGLRIRRLHERSGGPLKAGQFMSIQNVFYSDTDAEPKDYDVRRILSASALILRRGEPYGVYSAPPSEQDLPWLQCDAASVYLTADRLALLDVAAFKPLKLSADRGISLEIDFAAQKGSVHTTATTNVRIGRASVVLEPGMHTLLAEQLIGLDRLRRQARRSLDRAAERALTPPPRPKGGAGAKGLRLAWRLPAVKGDHTPYADEVQAIHAADLDADGTDEILVLRGRKLLCLDIHGKLLWDHETDGTVRAVCAADSDGDGLVEVFLGSDDEHLYHLSAEGRELKRIKVDVLLRVGTSSVRQPRVANIAVDDIDRDGKADVIVGTLNGNIVRYDAAFNKLWTFDRVEHGTREMQLLDLDQDGVKEILAANKYGAVEVVNAWGHALTGAYSELGDVEFDVADMDGDGQYEIVNGSSTGALTIATWGKRPRGTFPNHGYAVRDARMADLDGDGKPEAVIASETGYIYVLDADCDLKARVELSDSVFCLGLRGHDDHRVPSDGRLLEVFAGCADGQLYSLGLGGHDDHRVPSRPNATVRRRISVGFPVEVCALARAGGALQVVVGGDGKIAAASIEPEH